MDTDRRSPPDTVPWQGVNHLALITSNMDTTVRFWHGVIGAPLVATIGTDTFRHYFFALGATHSVAFFEYRGGGTDTIAKPAGVFDARAGHFDHLSIDLPNESALRHFRSRLVEHGTEVTDVIDHGLMRSVYFTDPNGIAMEASWWSDDPTSIDPTGNDAYHYFQDPDPVPAVAEIRRGELRHLPATTLVTEAVEDYHVDTRTP